MRACVRACVCARFGSLSSCPQVRTIRSAKELGYVSTLSGRRRTFPDLLLTGAGQDGFKRAYAERQAVNFGALCQWAHDTASALTNMLLQ